MCPQFNLPAPDKEFPGIYPRLKNPLDMNRATVERSATPLSSPGFFSATCSPSPYHSSLFSDFYFHRTTHQTFRFQCASIRSIPSGPSRATFRVQGRLREECSCSPFHTVRVYPFKMEYSSIPAIIPLSKYANSLEDGLNPIETSNSKYLI